LSTKTTQIDCILISRAEKIFGITNKSTLFGSSVKPELNRSLTRFSRKLEGLTRILAGGLAEVFFAKSQKHHDGPDFEHFAGQTRA
jgi:hypothetical protein